MAHWGRTRFLKSGVPRKHSLLQSTKGTGTHSGLTAAETSTSRCRQTSWPGSSCLRKGPRRDDRARHILQPSDFSGLRAWTIPALQGSPCLHTHKRAWPGGCCFCGVALNAPSALRYEPMGCSLNVRVGISFPRGLSFLCCKMRLTPRRPGIKWDDTWPG